MPDESGSLDFYLTEVSPRDKPWDVHRAEAQQVEQLYRAAEYHRYADRINQCSRWLGFKFAASDDGNTKLNLDQARFCRVRYCPVCQWRKTLMWYARFLKKMPKVLEDHPKARWLFLTLTVRNCPMENLRDVVRQMNTGWKRLSQRKEFPGIGWVKSLEVTRGRDDTAHPHFHVLMMVRSSYFTHGYIKQARWVELWQDCMRLDYAPSVHIRTVTRSNSRGYSPVDKLHDDDLSVVAPPQSVSNDRMISIIAGVMETLKYTVKMLDLLRSGDPEWLAGLTRQLHNTKAVAIGGVLKSYFSEDEPENLIGEDSDESVPVGDVLMWFGWREMKSRYVKVDKDELKALESLHTYYESPDYKPPNYEDIEF